MVAYSFKRIFVEPIRSGRKAHTIRGDRARHARPGEEVQLYCGMRSSSCFLIGRATCFDAGPIRLDFKRAVIDFAGQAPTLRGAPTLDAFARRDGFEGWEEMREFWRKEHNSIQQWSGVIVCWKDFQPPEGL